jgi:hypothetical protein
MPAKKPNNPVPLDDQLCYAIYSAGMAIQRVYKPLLDDLGLTYPQYLVLNVLWREDKLTVGNIADKRPCSSAWKREAWFAGQETRRTRDKSW